MKILQNKVLLVIGAIVALIIGVVFYLQRGEVALEIAPDSPITNGIVASFSADDFRRSYAVPGVVKLRPGTYQVIAAASGSTLFESTVIVTNGGRSVVVISVDENPNQTLEGSNPDQETIDKIEHYRFFPHSTGDYRLEALLNEGKTAIAKLRLTVTHHFAVEFNEQDRQDALAAAKQWLAENNIPDQFEIEVVDE